MLGIAMGAVTVVVYALGWGRAYGYDSAVTVHDFVLGRSPWEAFTTQKVFNNHPLFTFLEGIVADLTGSVSETTMRVLPITLASIAVGVLVWRVGRRLGPVPGLAAGTVLATSPIFAELAREARGYSLATLCVIVMGIAALDEPKRPVLFGTAFAAGLATHLYVLGAAAALGIVLWRTEGLTTRWRQAFLAGLVLGCAANIPAAQTRRGRSFAVDFPADLTWSLLGRTLPSLVLIGVIAASGLVTAQRQTRLLLTSVATLALLSWLVAPADLGARHFFWVIPGIALLVALGVRHRPRLGLLAFLGCLASAVALAGTWTAPELDNRVLGQALTGHEVCGNDLAESLAVYLPDLRGGTDCPIAVVVYPDRDPQGTARATVTWPVPCPSPSPDALVRAESRDACPTDPTEQG